MINLLSLPNEVLLHTAKHLPPSSILRLRLANKHLCAAIEKAFNAFCLEEVTFSLTSSGLRSLVRFARNPCAQPVKVLLLKIDGVRTHDIITKVRNQVYLSDALGLLRKRHDTLSIGMKYNPTGTIIPELRAQGAKAAAMANISDALSSFLLPAVAASGITISTLDLDVQSDSLHDYGVRAFNPMIDWLHDSCVSSAVTWDILLRYKHSKDDDDDELEPCDCIHLVRGTSLSITGYDPDRYNDVLPFLMTTNFTSLHLKDGYLPQATPNLLVPIYSCPVSNLCIENLTLLGDRKHHTITLSLQKSNTTLTYQMNFQCGPGGRDYKHLNGEFVAHNGAQIRDGIDRVLKGQHKNWVQVRRKSGRWGKK